MPNKISHAGAAKPILNFPGLLRLAAIILIFVFLPGCVNFAKYGSNALVGLAFNHTTLPLTTDVNNTPADVTHAEGKIIQIKEPFSGYGLYAEWDSNAIGDIASANGLKKVYFADMEVFSILGIWTKRKVHIYGE